MMGIDRGASVIRRSKTDVQWRNHLRDTRGGEVIETGDGFVVFSRPEDGLVHIEDIHLDIPEWDSASFSRLVERVAARALEEGRTDLTYQVMGTMLCATLVEAIDGAGLIQQTSLPIPHIHLYYRDLAGTDA